jgi:hypothetical protein
LRRVTANLKQSLPFQKALAGVESENARGCLPDRSQGEDREAVRVEVEVIPPALGARIEEAYPFISTGYDRGDVASLVPIADEACIREVVLTRWPTMLFADDVIDLTSEKCVFSVNEAILTKMVRPGGNEPSEIGTNVTGAH